MPDHNPWLNQQKRTPEGDPPKGGEDTIERPAEVKNITWQTRAASPTPYEQTLCDALERLFGEGVDTLDQLVAGLNSSGIAHPDGGEWTVANYESAMARLGA